MEEPLQPLPVRKFLAGEDFLPLTPDLMGFGPRDGNALLG